MTAMACTCRLARILQLLARRGVSWTLLVTLSVLHPLVHGTPLDSGALDAFLANLQAWAVMSLPHAEVDQ